MAGPQGTEFVTVFMQNYNPSYNNTYLQLFITGYQTDTTATVWVNKSNFKKNVILKQSSVSPTTIPPNFELLGVSKSYNVVVVQSDKEISITSMNFKALSADTSVIYPVSSLGTEYYIVTPLNGPSDSFKEFAVVSAGEPTNVDIYLKGEVTFQEETYLAGSKLTVLLEAYNAIQLLSKDDLSGSRVVSQKPVAVLSGHTCSWKNTQCNHVYEQLLPVSSWDTTFIVPPIVYQTKTDIVFVAASQKTTINYQSGSTKESKALSAGQVAVLDVEVKTPLFISASAGIQVIYYCTGWQDKLGTYDTTLINIPSINSYCSSYYLIGFQDFDNYGMLVARSEDVSKLTFNKKEMSGLSWSSIIGTEYSWSTQPLTKGFSFQMLENPSSFLLLSYGTTQENNYGSQAICKSLFLNYGYSFSTGYI
ncbi:IgGFc-binding protein-like [Bombina bombina]|uniref:IgGFc-binding protein-like n=1 Tax=Bombina bombina TaxID=8345 RepID=UPI00235A4F65|nr:IgGFc-binding protein-like [Bombina bombina]